MTPLRLRFNSHWCEHVSNGPYSAQAPRLLRQATAAELGASRGDSLRHHPFDFDTGTGEPLDVTEVGHVGVASTVWFSYWK